MSNLNAIHFQQRPTVAMERSTFLTPKNIKTTFNVGELIPFYIQQDIYPGDTFRLKNISAVIRASTPIHPTMDNAYADFYFFAIPKRICWEHFRDMMGENRLGPWSTNAIEYTEPQLIFRKTTSDSTSFTIQKGDIAHYMGLPLFNPTLSAGETKREFSVSRLPFTAYIKTWNEYFRCTSVESPAYEPYDDTDHYTINDSQRGNTNYDSWHTLSILTDTGIQCHPAPVNRFADFYSTATPQPQRGDAIHTPLGTECPVVGTGKTMVFEGSFAQTGDYATQGTLYNSTSNSTGLGLSNGSLTGDVGDSWGTSSVTSGSANKLVGLSTDKEKSGLKALLAEAIGPTVDAMRLAFATQRILQRDVYGNRFREIILNHFHTQNADARMQIPEFLFSFRQPLSINEVPQTSSTDATTPQGNLAGYSHTVTSNSGFVKSFTEWSIILGVMCVRTDHSYSQGVEKQWLRKRRLDYYWPELAHIGEQPILQKNLCLTGIESDDNAVFGYQEAWSEMKYERNLNTGAFDPMYAQTLASWHYGDAYANAPVLSPEWMNETKDYFDRTLAVTSAVEDQLLCDIHLDIAQTKGMPIYNIPGLIDHY